ncbi:ABC transporter substrate-binding protein [Actinacidiphila oryziradicis]|uniref:Extracellular solute-binding protein n=1 Tax=Actinacidiphila oryziradicis TaxID=2571141 RepID=A0A4U0SGX5_9ACTN|nr:extracellular solute-binding protein [Actinacidiphila oryziradicis]TKA08890.1 extracellular solute-binding protein [Actinacidiphila oryziradicis]
MPNSGKRALALCVALGVSGALTACGGSDSASGSPSGSAAKPVTLTYWGAQDGQQAVVNAWNASHATVKLKYTRLTGTDPITTLRNAAKAGNAPCLMQTSAEQLTTLASERIVADITQWISPHKSGYNESAYAEATIQGKVYGAPTSAAPAFTVYRADIFDKYKLKVPTTWNEFVAAGKVLAKHGIHITNYAGEDPSTLETMAMQAGAHWYAIDGDSWKVNLLDPGSLKAANVIQQIVDSNLNSSVSFADYAAVQRNYDNGGAVTRQISTWQMSGMVKNFTKSNGQWALAPWPAFDGESPAIPAGTNNSGGVTVVTEQCQNRQQAAEAANWMSTNSTAVKIMSNPATGSAFYPAIADASPYLDGLITSKLLGKHTAAAKPVIVNSIPTIVKDWTFGPDWTAMYTEMAGGWAKVLTKQQTVVQLLQHMQKWTVDDLKTRGISVKS